MPPNRLIDQKSPYLLQHAHNPVDWYPWGEEAFSAARALDRPIFLSIGYATCHWCHVMERESFEDAEVAGLMNEAFINIKVDREERPDIDGIYMTVAQLLAGQGGWPLTILMLPDRRPFFAATYIPKTARFGRPGMLELIPRIREVWMANRDQLADSAAAIHETLVQHATAASAPTSLGEGTLRQGYVELAGLFDREHAGFGQAPKFPTPHLLLFLLRYWHRTGADAPLAMVRQTLAAMRAGGIYDHVGFGFHRYATDRIWLVPHFEKMLYDQAMLVLAYTEGWQAIRDAAFERVVRETLAYVERDLADPEGGFYSAEDADSEGAEGKFYLWSLDELRDVVGEDADLAASVWGAQAGGNFDEEATRTRTGGNILHRAKAPAAVAATMGIGEAALTERLERARERLFARRVTRVRPLLDDKILTDWNGLVIAAAARAGAALGEPRFVRMAERAADVVWRRMWRDDALLHRYREGESAIGGNLDDYAFLAWGEVELHQATLNPRHLQRALTLVDAMLERFWDPTHGGLFFSPAERDDLIVRMKDIGDGALPSGTAVALYDLLWLGRLTGRPAYEDRAGTLVDACSAAVAARPSAVGFFLVALDFAIGPSQELVVVGDAADPRTGALLAVPREGWHPRLVVLHRPPGDGPPLAELAPVVRDFGLVDGQPAAYLCQGFACERPVTEPEQLRRLLAGG